MCIFFEYEPFWFCSGTTAIRPASAFTHRPYHGRCLASATTRPASRCPTAPTLRPLRPALVYHPSLRAVDPRALDCSAVWFAQRVSTPQNGERGSTQMAPHGTALLHLAGPQPARPQHLQNNCTRPSPSFCQLNGMWSGRLTILAQRCATRPGPNGTRARADKTTAPMSAAAFSSRPQNGSNLYGICQKPTKNVGRFFCQVSTFRSNSGQPPPTPRGGFGQKPVSDSEKKTSWSFRVEGQTRLGAFIGGDVVFFL